MACWLHKIPLSDRCIPREAYQLAATYQLGIPIRRYSNAITNILHVFSSIAAISTGLLLMIHLGGHPIMFSFCNQFPLLGSSSLPAICTSGGKRYMYDYWLGLAIALTFFVGGVIAVTCSIKELLRHSRTYECTEVFVVIEGINTVIKAIRWDQIVHLQQGSSMRVGLRTVNVSHNCFAVGKDEAWHKITYIGLRKRIEQKLALQS